MGDGRRKLQCRGPRSNSTNLSECPAEIAVPSTLPRGELAAQSGAPVAGSLLKPSQPAEAGSSVVFQVGQLPRFLKIRATSSPKAAISDERTVCGMGCKDDATARHHLLALFSRSQDLMHGLAISYLMEWACGDAQGSQAVTLLPTAGKIMT